MVGWLAGWLVGWLIGWLSFGWLAQFWLVDWLVGWLVVGPENYAKSTYNEEFFAVKLKAKTKQNKGYVPAQFGALFCRSLYNENMAWQNSSFYGEREHTGVIFFSLSEIKPKLSAAIMDYY